MSGNFHISVDIIDSFVSPEQLYVQYAGENTTASASPLYRDATKYNFYNADLLKPSKLADVFRTEEKLSEESPGQVSRDLQSFLLRRLFSSPRASASPQKNSVASYITIKLGRLGLYTVNHKFSYFNNFTAEEESGQSEFSQA